MFGVFSYCRVSTPNPDKFNAQDFIKIAMLNYYFYGLHLVYFHTCTHYIHLKYFKFIILSL